MFGVVLFFFFWEFFCVWTFSRCMEFFGILFVFLLVVWRLYYLESNVFFCFVRSSVVFLYMNCDFFCIFERKKCKFFFVHLCFILGNEVDENFVVCWIWKNVRCEGVSIFRRILGCFTWTCCENV